MIATPAKTKPLTYGEVLQLQNAIKQRRQFRRDNPQPLDPPLPQIKISPELLVKNRHQSSRYASFKRCGTIHRLGWRL